MPKEITRVTFANLVCTFGNKGLLDYAQSSVIPAFLDDQLMRKYGASSYLFLGTELKTLERPGKDSLFLLYGRFVYNTRLRRTQVLDGKSLKADEADMASAPSALFVLILNNHKLIYALETPYAPSLEQFATTLQHFVNRKHDEFLRVEYERLKMTAEPATRQQLRLLHPSAEVQAVPLSNPSTIDNFIKSFGTLSQIEFRVIRPNQEIQASLVFEGLQQLRQDIGSNRTTVTHSNKDGLDKAVATSQISQAAATGNENVVLTGKDMDGNRLRGTNTDMKVEVSVTLPNAISEKAEKLATTYEALVEKGTLSVDKLAHDPLKLLQDLFSRFL